MLEEGTKHPMSIVGVRMAGGTLKVISDTISPDLYELCYPFQVLKQPQQGQGRRCKKWKCETTRLRVSVEVLPLIPNNWRGGWRGRFHLLTRWHERLQELVPFQAADRVATRFFRCIWKATAGLDHIFTIMDLRGARRYTWKRCD